MSDRDHVNDHVCCDHRVNGRDHDRDPHDHNSHESDDRLLT